MDLCSYYPTVHKWLPLMCINLFQLLVDIMAIFDSLYYKVYACKFWAKLTLQRVYRHHVPCTTCKVSHKKLCFIHYSQLVHLHRHCHMHNSTTCYWPLHTTHSFVACAVYCCMNFVQGQSAWIYIAVNVEHPTHHIYE